MCPSESLSNRHTARGLQGSLLEIAVPCCLLLSFSLTPGASGPVSPADSLQIGHLVMHLGSHASCIFYYKFTKS